MELECAMAALAELCTRMLELEKLENKGVGLPEKVAFIR
jgi:hypothetical protein